MKPKFARKTDSSREHTLFKRTLEATLYSTPFSYCCGIEEIGAFQSFSEAKLKSFPKAVTEVLKEWSKYEGSPALVVVSLSQGQISYLKKPVEDAGFKLVSKGLNHNTSNNIYLFVKTLNKVRRM